MNGDREMEGVKYAIRSGNSASAETTQSRRDVVQQNCNLQGFESVDACLDHKEATNRNFLKCPVIGKVVVV